MATIPQYEAPDRQLTESDKGASAFEQAGRRTGPAYNEAATLTKQAGEAEIEGIKSRRWAFDMLNLEKSIEAPMGLRAMPSQQNNGIQFKVEGGVGGSGHGGGSGGGSGGGGSGGGHDGGARGKVAAGLSQIGAAMARGNQYRSQTIDTASGLDINDPKLKPQRYSKVLEGGQLRTYDKLTGQTSKAKEGPNSKAEQEAKDASQFTPDEWGANTKEAAAARSRFEKAYGYNPADGKISDYTRETGAKAGGRDTSSVDDKGYTHEATNPWNYDRSALPNSPSMGQGDVSPYGSHPGPDYGAMQQSMAPGAVNDVANTVSDMNNTFGGGSDEGSGDSGPVMDTGAGSGGGYSDSESGGMNFGGGGDEE